MQILSMTLGRVSPKWRMLSEWLAVYEGLLAQRSYDPQTLKNRHANLKHIRRLWGGMTIRGIRPHHISTALREFLPERSATAQRVLAELRDAFNEAIANGWAEMSPAAHVRPPKHKIRRKRLSFQVWLGMREIAAASRQKWVGPMLLLALVTGQRRADLAKMRFDDVFDGHLHVEQQKKAGKECGARVAIPLSLRLDAIGMSVGDVVELCRHYAKPGPTLLRRKDGKSIEVSSLSARFGECIRKHLGPHAFKFREWPSLHEVRSLTARLYALQDADVQTLLGHKDAKMTALYQDDRGLTARDFKHVKLAA